MAQKWESRYDNGILEAKAFSSDWLPILSQPDTKFGFLVVWEPPLSLYIQFLFVFPLAHIYFAYILFCVTITTYYPHELLNWRSDWSECPISTWVGTCQESHLPSEHSTLGTKRVWKMKQEIDLMIVVLLLSNSSARNEHTFFSQVAKLTLAVQSPDCLRKEGRTALPQRSWIFHCPENTCIFWALRPLRQVLASRFLAPEPQCSAVFAETVRCIHHPPLCSCEPGHTMAEKVTAFVTMCM